MKTIKFTPELTDLIKSGKKFVTFRLFDDKDLSINDKVILATRDGENVIEFANARLISVRSKKIKDLVEDDYVGHEPVVDPVKTYRKYYGDKVNEETKVKIIKFQVSEFLK